MCEERKSAQHILAPGCTGLIETSVTFQWTLRWFSRQHFWWCSSQLYVMLCERVSEWADEFISFREHSLSTRAMQHLERSTCLVRLTNHSNYGSDSSHRLALVKSETLWGGTQGNIRRVTILNFSVMLQDENEPEDFNHFYTSFIWFYFHTFWFRFLI